MGTVQSSARRRALRLIGATGALFIFLAMAAIPAAADADGYLQTNLVSDLSTTSPRHIDTHLVNPWGLVAGPATPWWVADNGTGVSTLYDGDGTALSLVVTVPLPNGTAEHSAPTGIVFNGGTDFKVSKGTKSGPSRFIFATEDGTISGWNPTVDLHLAVLKVDNSGSGAVYKGLAIGSTGAGTFLYAANFHAGTVDVFDKNFAPATLAGKFKDSRIPKGYAPFGIQNLEGKLYVTYALQNAEKHDDVAGPGHGFVDVYGTNGVLLRRLIRHGRLNSPWGLALAPSQGFGEFSGDLLVGNFGDGRINAYDLEGDFDGTLKQAGQPIVVSGLWALAFGNGGAAGPTTTLFFTAGIDEERHGLFGSIEAVGDKD
ncbi:MAG: TIGR03118 family protein [Candidatus Dormibacteraeota bacterium]|nr:TIGR03118 family protein [Candidatus Dormibacteraeota bacterium]